MWKHLHTHTHWSWGASTRFEAQDLGGSALLQKVWYGSLRVKTKTSFLRVFFALFVFLFYKVLLNFEFALILSFMSEVGYAIPADLYQHIVELLQWCVRNAQIQSRPLIHYINLEPHPRSTSPNI